MAISGILLIPLILFSLSPQGRARAISQSAFRPAQVESRRIDYDQKSKKPLRFLSKYLFPEPIYYTYLATKAYVDHFSPVFLFTKGDQIGRHSQVDIGQIHIFEAIFIGGALFSLVVPVPATLPCDYPHTIPRRAQKRKAPLFAQQFPGFIPEFRMAMLILHP